MPEKRRLDDKISQIVIGVAIILIASGVFYAIEHIGPFISEPPHPSFDFEYVDLQSNVPLYEVTKWLADPNSTIDMSKIQVRATYKGEDYNGQVDIQIKTPSGETKPVANWSNFQKSHLDIPLDLTPLDLFKYSGLNYGDPEGKRGWFEIEVAYPGKKLHSEKITVVYTPWLHTTQLSDVAILAGESITACVTVKNFGSPSKFNVIGLLYDATSINTSTLESARWAPSYSWDHKNESDANYVTGMIDTNEECTAELTLNGNFFEERHIYILETYAVKNRPYLKYRNGTWITSPDSWRVRDQPHYSTIVVLAP